MATPPTGFSFESPQPFDFGTVLSNLGQPNRTWSGLENIALELSPANALGNGTIPPGGTFTTPGLPDVGAPPVFGNNIGDTGNTDATLSGSGAASTVPPISQLISMVDPTVMQNNNVGDTGVSDAVLSGQAPSRPTQGGGLPIPNGLNAPSPSAGTVGTASGGALSTANIGSMNQILATMGMSALTAAEINALGGIPGGNPDPAAPPGLGESPVAEGIGPDTAPTSPGPSPTAGPLGGPIPVDVNPETNPDAPMLSDNPNSAPGISAALSALMSEMSEGLAGISQGPQSPQPTTVDPEDAPNPEASPQDAPPPGDVAPADTSEGTTGVGGVAPGDTSPSGDDGGVS